MGPLPSSMVAAVATSAAAGKNPWLPLGVIFLLAAPSSVPSFLMNEDLHRQLHGLAPVEVLWTLGAIFGVLALADSLADKIGFIEKWLVPISTAWRPFAGVACATIIGVAAARDGSLPEVVAEPEVVEASLLVGGSVVGLTIGVSALFTWIATMGKTGTRLLLAMVPIPGLRLAHSFVDDFFAFGATVAGIAFGDTFLVPFLLAVYLAVGLVTGPLLTRLTFIHLKIGWALLRKGRRAATGERAGPPEPPSWVRAYAAENGLDGATILPSYVFRAPEVGRCRAGHLILGRDRTVFLTRVMFRPRALVVEEDRLSRVGYADTTTNRVVTLVSRLASGALGEVHVYLFPALEEEVTTALEAGLDGFVRVRVESPSARAALPGFADRERSVRFQPSEKAGSLRLQGILTIAAAIIGGVLSGGVFVPIGTGYFASPFWRRGLIGWLLSGYLSLCVLGTMGIGWPAAVLYASLLNAVALRDLTRNALKARVDGFVDRRAWLPIVASRVWVPAVGLADEADRWTADAEERPSDGSWRAIMQVVATA
ncbi:MAG: hypothetical protein KC619_12765 [Myxococcales bacterium]|nr:hypothetical protein [Myxococcales bacterium]